MREKSIGSNLIIFVVEPQQSIDEVRIMSSLTGGAVYLMLS